MLFDRIGRQKVSFEKNFQNRKKFQANLNADILAKFALLDILAIFPKYTISLFSMVIFQKK